MKNHILIAGSLLLALTAIGLQDQKEAAAWKALGAAVPNHKYPQKGRFQREPEPDYTQQIGKLDKALEAAKGTSAEPTALFYRGNTLFQLERIDEALAIFEDIKARFPKHGLVTQPWGPDASSKSAVDLAIEDAKKELEIRKTYAVKHLPAAVLDQGPRAVFHTTKGDFTIKFFKTAAPEAVANFKKLIQGGQYVDTYFHRVSPMQRVTGGCPNTKKDNRNREDDGDGSVGYDLPLEFNAALHTAGAVSMQRIAGKERASGCIFNICVIDQPDLNATEGVFGMVVDGLEIVKRITQERADDVSNPYEHIWIQGTEWIEG